MKSILLLCFSVFLSVMISYGQIVDYKRSKDKGSSNYYEIIENYNTSKSRLRSNGTSKETLSDKKARKHFERWAYYWKNRVDSEGNFPSSLQGWYNAGIIDEQGRMINKGQIAKIANNETWVNIGPQSVPEPNGYPNYPQMGRLNCFWRYEDASNSANNILLVGAPSGGVWKSTDNGNTWSPKLDQIAGIGVTDIASTSTDVNTPGVIYISTGDYDGLQIKSIGVYKSTDLGETFQATGLTYGLDEEEVLSDLMVIDAQTVLVGTLTGIKRTTDGGDTWTDVYSQSFQNYYGRFASSVDGIMCLDQYGGVYFSTDNGANWTVVRPDGNIFDGQACTVDESTGIFYIQNDNGQLSTYNPNDVSPSLSNIGSSTPEYDSQQAFNQTVALKDGLFISGAVEGYSSTDFGTTWYKSLNGYWDGSFSPGVYLHSDHHDIGTLDAGYSFYGCNDGGLSFITYDTKTDQEPTVEYKSSGVLVTQVYTVAITPQNNDYFVIGNQDNDGFSKEEHNGSTQWVAALAGDGICTAIDYSDSDIRYLGSQNGGLVRTDIGFSGNYTGTDISTPSGAGFVWPLKLHSTTPTTLFGGFGDVYKSTNKGGSWTSLNSGVGTVSYIETFGDHIFVVGGNSAKKSTDGGANWSTISQPAGDDINSLSFDQSDVNTVYASVSGYGDGDKVYKSTNGGSSWTNISAGLPNVVVNRVTLYQNQTDEILFAGTEIGVYVKTNTDDWVKLGVGLPNVIINDFEINYNTDVLVAATFGRGLWQVDIANFVTGLGKANVLDTNAPIVVENPVVDKILKIELQDNDSYSYKIYNAIGGVVKQGVLTDKFSSIDLSNAVKGAYVVRLVNSNNLVSSHKILLKD